MTLPRHHGTSGQAEKLISKQKEMATELSKINPNRPGHGFFMEVCQYGIMVLRHSTKSDALGLSVHCSCQV